MPSYCCRNSTAITPNLYRRRALDSATHALENRVGFHTNRQTKALVIGHLISLVRDSAYIERDTEACNELAVYERDPSGRYTARHGCHDDILMTRAIGLWVASQMPLRPTCLTSLSSTKAHTLSVRFLFPLTISADYTPCRLQFITPTLDI